MVIPTTKAGRALPYGTRLILAADDLLTQWGARTVEGYRITAEWGDEQPEGWYEPTFTVHYDDDLRREAAAQERERIRAALFARDYGEGDYAYPKDPTDARLVEPSDDPLRSVTQGGIGGRSGEIGLPND